MAAPTTIHDLPDDMLHEIFGRVFAQEPGKPSWPSVYTLLPPRGAHLALRCVCRRWRDIADWVRLSTSKIVVDTLALAEDGTVRARHPAAFKALVLACRPDGHHKPGASKAAASLIKHNADLRRSLSFLMLHSCCLPSLVLAVTPVASCTALTQLILFWDAHEKKERAVPSSMLAPLSALQKLRTLRYGHSPVASALHTPALRAPLPALPDAPRLTCLELHMVVNFVPVGSDAALGRLRKLSFLHQAPVQELVDAEDPFLLRAAFDAGMWLPSRLTGLQELEISFHPLRRDSRAPSRPSRTRSRAGSEWAPLASQVTKLVVKIESDGYKRPSTGIVAGLGALTALRYLHIDANTTIARPGWLEPVSIDRVRAPHLTFLHSDCVSTPVNLVRFPDLVYLFLASITLQPPLNLRSLVARSSLTTLQLATRVLLPGLVNLAELFVGGSGWPVLENLGFENIALEWDTTGLPGAPTAAEFAERARQLLPALVRVEIAEPFGRGALPDRSRVGFVVACRRHVVPTLKGMNTVKS